MNQEAIAFFIVGVTVVILCVQFFRTVLARPLSEFFLKSGKVKIAMLIRKQISVKSGCQKCKA